MNRIHPSIWTPQTATFVAVGENTRSARRQDSISSTSAASVSAGGCFGLKALAASLMVACGVTAFAQPTNGVVSAGSATIGGTPGAMVITQTTANVAINWQSFGIRAGESVQFVQPVTRSVAMNRVVGPDPSSILGSLSANGKVFLVNPNGILFGAGASVNVGGLVASTLGISDTDFMASNYRFSGAGTATVVNEGAITAADSGYVALLGANVSNQGNIIAQLGTVALAAGNSMTLDMAGDRLLSVTVNEGVVNALVESGGLIQADGGRVLMTTRAAGSLLANAVNNTGVIRAQTISRQKGSIRLLGGMETGTVNLASKSTLDASGIDGEGGFIETSAARVTIEGSATVDPPTVVAGEWLIGSAPVPGSPPAAAPPPSARPLTPLPFVVTPYTSADIVSKDVVFTVMPAVPMPFTTLYVGGPLVADELPAVAPLVTPLAMPIAPPEIHRVPLRRPKSGSN